MTSVSDFVNQNLNLAGSISQTTGIPIADILGQWGLETGWGSSFTGANNYGNISPGGVVASYSSPQAGAQAYANTLSRYNVDTSSPSAFAQSVATGGYATDPNYAAKLTGAIMTASAAMLQAGNVTSTLASPWYSTGLTGSLLNDMVNSPIGQSLVSVGQSVQSAPSSVSKVANSAGSSIGDWLSNHIGSYGLVFFGGILVIGALLISQKSTILEAIKS